MFNQYKANLKYPSYTYKPISDQELRSIDHVLDVDYEENNISGKEIKKKIISTQPLPITKPNTQIRRNRFSTEDINMDDSDSDNDSDSNQNNIKSINTKYQQVYDKKIQEKIKSKQKISIELVILYINDNNLNAIKDMNIYPYLPFVEYEYKISTKSKYTCLFLYALTKKKFKICCYLLNKYPITDKIELDYDMHTLKTIKKPFQFIALKFAIKYMTENKYSSFFNSIDELFTIMLNNKFLDYVSILDLIANTEYRILEKILNITRLDINGFFGSHNLLEYWLKVLVNTDNEIKKDISLFYQMITRDELKIIYNAIDEGKNITNHNIYKDFFRNYEQKTQHIISIIKNILKLGARPDIQYLTQDTNFNCQYYLNKKNIMQCDTIEGILGEKEIFVISDKFNIQKHILNGMNPNIKNKYNIPLICLCGDLDLYKYLEISGADINIDVCIRDNNDILYKVKPLYFYYNFPSIYDYIRSKNRM